MLKQEFKAGIESSLPLMASSLASMRDISTTSDPFDTTGFSRGQKLSFIDNEGISSLGEYTKPIYVDAPLPTHQAIPMYAWEISDNNADEFPGCQESQQRKDSGPSFREMALRWHE